MYHFVVCVKQVPDTTEVKIDPITNTLVRKGVPSIVNPFDRGALELALELKDQLAPDEVKVTAITMGPPQAEDVLRECLTLGADEAVLVSGREFGGADTLATSYTLAAALRRIGPADIIFCGKQAIDGDTAQVGPEIAEHLHLPQITLVKKVEMVEGAVQAERELEDETETVRAALPVVLTVTTNQAKPRYGNILRFLWANEDYKIPALTAADLEVDAGRLGLNGSPTKVSKIFTPEKEKRGTRLENMTGKQQADEICKVLSHAGVI